MNLARFISLATPAFFMKVEKTLAGVPPSEQTVYKLLEKLDGEGLLNVPAAGGADGDEVAFPSTYQFDSVGAQQTHPLWLHDEARAHTVSELTELLRSPEAGLHIVIVRGPDAKESDFTDFAMYDGDNRLDLSLAAVDSRQGRRPDHHFLVAFYRYSPEIITKQGRGRQGQGPNVVAGRQHTWRSASTPFKTPSRAAAAATAAAAAAAAAATAAGAAAAATAGDAAAGGTTPQMGSPILRDTPWAWATPQGGRASDQGGEAEGEEACEEYEATEGGGFQPRLSL